MDITGKKMKSLFLILLQPHQNTSALSCVQKVGLGNDSKYLINGMQFKKLQFIRLK